MASTRVDLALNYPKPLQALTEEHISPSNLELMKKRDLSGYEIGWARRLKMRWQAWQLTRELRRVGWDATVYELKTITERMHTIRREAGIVYEQRGTAPEAWEAHPLYEEFMQLLKRYSVHHLAYKANRSLYEEHRRIERALKAHERAVLIKKIDRANDRDLRREVEIYEKLIVDRLNRLGFCNRYEISLSRGRKRMVVEPVTFSEIIMTLDAHYLRIDTSYKTAFGGWKTNVPQGVNIASLTSEETCLELTVACKRTVTAKVSSWGAMYILSRFDMPDTLMPYLQYKAIDSKYREDLKPYLPVNLGVSVNREVLTLCLLQYPHWLIAGYTKTGKSNLVNVILAQLISHNEPDDLRLVLVDLKGGLEFSYYEDIPHLLCPIIDSVEGVARSVTALLGLMYHRFNMFRGVAKEYVEYRRKRPNEVLPYIALVFDETASFHGYGDDTKIIDHALNELTRMGRAVGISVFLCTQRPDVQAIKGSTKANLSARVVGRMATTADSMTVLGNGYAADIPDIPGRMVVMTGPTPSMFQAAHILDEDLDTAIKSAKAMVATSIEFNNSEPQSITQARWNVDRVIELSIKHLGGRIGWRPVYEAADGLTQSEARRLVEEIWAMPLITYQGQTYVIKTGRGKEKFIVIVGETA